MGSLAVYPSPVPLTEDTASLRQLMCMGAAITCGFLLPQEAHPSDWAQWTIHGDGGGPVHCRMSNSISGLDQMNDSVLQEL